MSARAYPQSIRFILLVCLLLVTLIFPASPAAADAPGPSNTLVAGFNRTCRITTSGSVECWGANQYGAVGDGTLLWRSAPVAVPGLKTVMHLSSYMYLTCATTAEGLVYCWGKDYAGQLGDGRTVKEPVTGIQGAWQTAVGSVHACALLRTGKVICWGNNQSGQFIRGAKDGVGAEPVEIPGVSDAKQIVAGSAHTCALTGSGAVLCWGDNAKGQAGGESPLVASPTSPEGLESGVVNIAAGDLNTCAVKSTGAAVCWGDNYAGQLGVGSKYGRATAPMPVTGLSSGVAQLAIGRDHACARKTDGSTWCWGSNAYGKAGAGASIVESLTPAEVAAGPVVELVIGPNHTCARREDGTLACWGLASSGQLANGQSYSRAVAAEVRDLPTGLAEIVAGYDRACAIAKDGAAWCWGRNDDAVLGDGSDANRSLPVLVAGTPVTGAVRGMGLGWQHTCFIVDSPGITRRLYCWGNNSSGQLGNGTTTNAVAAQPVAGLSDGIRQVAAGSKHTCAVDAAGGVQCWGQNGGKLGNGQSSDSATPVPVIGLASGVRKIALGDAHACALLEDGAVKCWGAGFYGQLGQGLQASASAPVDVIGLGPGSAKDIAAQATATCALLIDGSARCWGNNIFGQLGDGTKNNSARPVVVVGLSDITAISGGGYHACALTADHAVKCWGANANGAVGDGTRDQQLTPVAALGLSGNVAQVSAGLYHTCVLAGDGRAKCVGADDFGQLGQGVLEYSSVPAPGGLPLTPALRLSHDAAGPGSVITLLGEGIGQPGSALLRINGRPAALLPITQTGAVVAFVEAEGATPGAFDISVAGAGNATLTLSADWPARAAEGDGRRVRLTETLPSLYLPTLTR